MDDTTWVYLDASKKIVYLRYRRFLKTNHKYRSKIYFRYYDNKAEDEPPLERRKNGQQVFEMVKTYVSSSKRRIHMGQRKIVTPNFKDKIECTKLMYA